MHDPIAALKTHLRGAEGAEQNVINFKLQSTNLLI